MPISIKIEEKDVERLIGFYRSTIGAIDFDIGMHEKDIEELSNEKNRIKDIINELINVASYNSKWTYEEKIKFALNKANKALSTGEIIQVLKQYEIEMESKLKNISSIISDKIQEGVFIRIDNPNGASKISTPELDLKLQGEYNSSDLDDF